MQAVLGQAPTRLALGAQPASPPAWPEPVSDNHAPAANRAVQDSRAVTRYNLMDELFED